MTSLKNNLHITKRLSTFRQQAGSTGRRSAAPLNSNVICNRNNMDIYRKWKRVNLVIWLVLLLILTIASITSFYEHALFRYLLAAVLLMFFFVQFKVSFCKCSACNQYIINPAHFWFGTAIFTHAKSCPKCGAD